MFRNTKHGENTARQLDGIERGPRMSVPVVAYRGTDKDEQARSIPLDRIITRKQIREDFDEPEMQELVESFKEHGQQQACTVFWSELDSAFVLVTGERRLRAATRAGNEKLKCNVLDHEPTEQEHHELQLIENVQRQDLKPIEEAKAYKRFIDEFGYTQTQIAERTKKDQSTISRALSYMKLSTEVQSELAESNAPRTLVDKMVRLKSVDDQRDMLQRYDRGEITVRDAQKETARSTNGARKPNTKQTRIKKSRGIDLRATGKKKHTNTDYAMATLDWCEDLATDKRASVDIEAVRERVREIQQKLDEAANEQRKAA